MTESESRWEWRTFGTNFGRAEGKFKAMIPTGIHESDELYLLSDTRANVKVRADLMDVKQLIETNADGLQRWRPTMKAPFPVDDAAVAHIFAALDRPLPALERESYTLDQFVAELVPGAGLRPVQVHKRRVRYTVNGCTSEVSDVLANGVSTRTIAIESGDAAAVVAAVKSVGLWAYINTSYGQGLKAALAGRPARVAVIDVGTDSVKFHIGQRLPDGSWQRVRDRAEITRLGERVNEQGTIQAEPLERTAEAIAGMVAEAHAEGAIAISCVGTAVFRLATNSAEAIAAIKARSGLEVEVLSGEEESRIAFLAARSVVANTDEEVGVFDTGGGSSQFTYGAGNAVNDRFSVNVGAISYTERFGLDGAVTPAVIGEALVAIAAELAGLDQHPRPTAVVGMGGAVTNITAVSQQLTTYDPDAIQGSILGRSEVERQIELYRSMSAGERRSVAGLQPKRAEIILAGACIVRTIIEKLGVESFTVSDRGLRHGMLIERYSQEV